MVAWPAMERPPALTANAVHVWALPLDLATEKVAALLTTLSPDERERAERYSIEQLRHRFIAGRGGMRAVLAKYLEIAPAELEFSYTSRGKPALASIFNGPAGQVASNLISTPVQQGVASDGVGETVSTVSTERGKPFNRFSVPAVQDTALERGADEGVREISGLAGARTSGLHFNLAHSDQLALLAVTRVAALGVDVERIRPFANALGIAERFFSAGETTAFEALPPGAREEAFFHLWTRKEAWLKATGEGIAASLSKIEVTFLPTEPPGVRAIAGDPVAGKAWSICPLKPADGFVGALAIQALDVQLSCWRAEI